MSRELFHEAGDTLLTEAGGALRLDGDRLPMSTTTLKAILDRFQAVCEGATLALTASPIPFSRDRAPNAVVESQYALEDLGLRESQPATSNVEYRLDAVKVWLSRRTAFAGQTSLETLETSLVTLEREILADGPAHDYHARVVERDPPSPATENGEVLIAALTFAIDYDFATA